VKARLTVLLVASFQIFACQGQEGSGAAELCATESRALVVASELLSKQSQATEYQTDRARAQDFGDKWNVSIPLVTKPGVVVLPERAIIEVNKANCVSRWVPQR
jgi:hypothetical protein